MPSPDQRRVPSLEAASPDFGDEPFIPTTSVPNLPPSIVPRTQPGRKISIGTAHRWSKPGVSVRGRRIRLRTVRVGGRSFTKQSWVIDFFRELTAAADGPAPNDSAAPAKLSPSEVDRQLDALGIV